MRVVVRNVVCTGVISIAYLIATVVVGFTLLNVSAEDDKVGMKYTTSLWWWREL